MRCGFCLCYAPACFTRRLPAAVVRRQEDGSCAIPAQEDRALVDRRASARAQASSVHAPHPRGLGLQEPTAMRKAKVSCRPSSRVADTAARGGQARLSFSHSVRCCQVRRPHACRMQESARHSWSVVDTVSAFWPECSSRLPLGSWLRRPIPTHTSFEATAAHLASPQCPFSHSSALRQVRRAAHRIPADCFGIAFGGEWVRPSAIRSALHRTGRRSAAARSAGGRGAAPLGRPTGA